jgi:hypothetical protein
MFAAEDTNMVSTRRFIIGTLVIAGSWLGASAARAMPPTAVLPITKAEKQRVSRALQEKYGVQFHGLDGTKVPKTVTLDNSGVRGSVSYGPALRGTVLHGYAVHFDAKAEGDAHKSVGSGFLVTKVVPPAGKTVPPSIMPKSAKGKTPYVIDLGLAFGHFDNRGVYRER